MSLLLNLFKGIILAFICTSAVIFIDTFYTSLLSEENCSNDAIGFGANQNLRIGPSKSFAPKNSVEPSMDVKLILEQYKQLHQKIMSEDDTEIPKRYLLYKEPTSGLGNQEISLVSAFLFALVTNRALLIYQGTNTLSDPFGYPITEWRWERVADKYTPEHFKENSIFLEFECCLRGYKPNTTIGSFYEKMFCSDLNEVYPQQFVIVWSNQYFLPLIANNPYYRDKLKDIFGKHFFGPLEQFLFRLKPEYQQVVHSFEHEYFRGKHVIGLQIRVANIKEGGRMEALDTFFKCADYLTPYPRDNAVWFIATDSQEIRDKAKQQYPDLVVYYEQNITGDNHFFTTENKFARIVDNWLLSKCDDVIATIASSFGYVAASRLPSKRPYLLSGYANTCYQKVVAEPCFHYWEPVRRLTCYDENAWSAEDFNQGKCRF